MKDGLLKIKFGWVKAVVQKRKKESTLSKVFGFITVNLIIDCSCFSNVSN
jgi:hypothetical protein